MSVYVDDMRAKYKNMIMCHMIADTSKELLDMADRLYIRTKWIQFPGTYKEHFDICLSKKKLAITFGAKQISWMDYGRKIDARKKLNEKD